MPDGPISVDSELPHRGSSLDPLFWRPTRIGPPSAWYGHIPFAFWVVSATRPSVLVELGTEHGVSYAAFCDAVARSGLSTQCFAVDTWLGDQHSGSYDEHVFADFQHAHSLHYAGFSTLLRMRFDDAVNSFPDGSIDLLHIDGEHTYEAVCHDFETWLPKLSGRAVALFHDVNVREGGFGAWRFWHEIKDRYLSFEFVHGSGLGVLATGANVADPIRSLCTADENSAKLIRERFALLGERWQAEMVQRDLNAIAAELNSKLQAETDARLVAERAMRGQFAMTEADMRISVVIPLFNGAPYIERALQSVLLQSRPPEEIIVVDDGSTDGGPLIVERMSTGAPIILLRKPNGGQSSARNIGIARSTGNLIALLDQDDIWYPDHLAELTKPFLCRRGRPLGWVYSNLDEIDQSGRMVYCSRLRNLPFHHPKRELFACLTQDMFILPSSVLISRTALKAVGGFDETLAGYEDDDLFLRMFRAGFDNVFLDTPLTQWRIHAGGSSYSYRMAESRMRYVRKLLAEFAEDPADGSVISRHFLAPRFFPLVVRDYRLALMSGSARQIRQAAADLGFIANLHKPRIRAVIRCLMPILKRPSLCLPLRPFMPVLRPLARRVLS